MDSEDFSHLAKRLVLAPIKEQPYSHFYTEGVFPEAFYLELTQNIPETSSFSPMENYPTRFVFHFKEEELQRLPFGHFLFWQKFGVAMRSHSLAQALLKKFKPQLWDRKIGVDVLLIRDQSDYSIGPHTDHPKKVISLLFYLPETGDQKHLGTSVYVPKNRAFQCEGYEHHPFDGFERVYRAPFLPNSVFGFARSNVSFHGVEPIGKQEKERILLSYTIWEQT